MLSNPLAEQPPEVAAVSATASVVEPPSASVESIVKEEEEEVDYSDPTDQGATFVQVLGLEESDLAEAVTPPEPTTSIATDNTDAAPGAPSSTVDQGPAVGAAVSAPDSSVDPGVVEGAGPSAPSRPPRTRGARGGRDSQYKNIRRAYYQGDDQLRNWIFEHSRPKLHRPGFSLPKIDFDRASAKYQELLVNWDFFHSRATTQQILALSHHFTLLLTTHWIKPTQTCGVRSSQVSG